MIEEKPKIIARDVKVVYGDKEALRDVSLDVMDKTVTRKKVLKPIFINSKKVIILIEYKILTNFLDVGTGSTKQKFNFI